MQVTAFHEVTVGFRRDGKINIDATVMGDFSKHVRHFKVSGAGEPIYKNGSFYIHNVKFGPVELLALKAHELLLVLHQLLVVPLLKSLVLKKNLKLGMKIIKD